MSQDLLRKGINSRHVKLEIKPDLFLEAGPKIIHPFNRKVERKWLGWLLPEGYPQSVHGDYLKFAMWTGLQGITASFIGGIKNRRNVIAKLCVCL